MSNFLMGLIVGSIGTASLIHFVLITNKARNLAWEKAKDEFEKHREKSYQRFKRKVGEDFERKT